MKIFLYLVIVGLSWAQKDWDTVTDMDTYIARPESVYGEQLVAEYDEGDLRVLVYNLTSLTWFDDTLTTTPVWSHDLVVVIPTAPVILDKALMHISGGDWSSSTPTNASGEVMDMKAITRATGGITSLVKQIPYQPLYFVAEGNTSRSEDAIIGYTWKLFIEETITNPEVILLFPMTKAAKLATDTVIKVASVEAGLTVTGMMPTGFSKRGWVSWLLGCMDRRVFAMAPIVFDLLNTHENLHHHYRSLGGWTWAFAPYYNTNNTENIDHPNFLIMTGHTDPLEYNSRLTMPKLLSGATGDQFFIPDGTHYWYDQINGEMHYILFENDEHSLLEHRTELWNNIAAFFHDVHHGIPRPDYTFTNRNRTDDCNITLTSNTTVTTARIWTADSTIVICEPHNTTDVADIDVCRRDFRLGQAAVPVDTRIVWNASSPVSLGNDDYTITMPKRTDELRDDNFRITHMQFEAASGLPGYNYVLSSQAQVIPDTLPFPRCRSPEECTGTLK